MDEQLLDLCRWARDHNAFYRRHHPSGVPWLELAPLTPAHLRTEDLLTSPAREAVALCTTGSEGTPKLIYREYAEQKRVAAGLARGLAAVLRPDDRVANLFLPGAAHLGMNAAIELLGAVLLPLGGHLPAHHLSRLLRECGATAAVGLSATLLSLRDVQLDRVVCGGELLSEGTRQTLQRSLQAELVAAPVYAAVDVGAMGYQCSQCVGSRGYHVLEEQVLIEAPEDEPGPLLVTVRKRRLQPLIRYALGDRGHYRRASCGRLLEVAGRADDVLIIGGHNLEPELVVAVLRRFPSLGPLFQLEARKVGPLDSLVLRVEACEPGAEAGPVRDALYEAEPKLGMLARDQRIAPLQVEFLPPGSFTGKVRRCVDLRPS